MHREFLEWAGICHAVPRLDVQQVGWDLRLVLFARRQLACTARTIVIMNQPAPLPPELDALASYLDGQVPDVRELFQYSLAMLMIEAKKAKVVETHTTDDGRQHMLIWTISDDSFSIVKPLVSAELLERMMGLVRGIAAQDLDEPK